MKRAQHTARCQPRQPCRSRQPVPGQPPQRAAPCTIATAVTLQLPQVASTVPAAMEHARTARGSCMQACARLGSVGLGFNALPLVGADAGPHAHWRVMPQLFVTTDSARTQPDSAMDGSNASKAARSGADDCVQVTWLDKFGPLANCACPERLWRMTALGADCGQACAVPWLAL